MGREEPEIGKVLTAMPLWLMEENADVKVSKANTIKMIVLRSAFCVLTDRLEKFNHVYKVILFLHWGHRYNIDVPIKRYIIPFLIGQIVFYINNTIFLLLLIKDTDKRTNLHFLYTDYYISVNTIYSNIQTFFFIRFNEISV